MKRKLKIDPLTDIKSMLKVKNKKSKTSDKEYKQKVSSSKASDSELKKPKTIEQLRAERLLLVTNWNLKI